MKLLHGLISNEEGQGLVEYAMIMGIIALGTAIALNLMGVTIERVFDTIRFEFISLPWD